MPILRQVILKLARSRRFEALVTTMPVTSSIVTSYVAGETTERAVAATQRLVTQGLHVTLDLLGEDVTDPQQAEATVAAYVQLIAELAERGLTPATEVSVKLSALGQSVPEVGEKLAFENAYVVCGAARAAGTTVTLDMEDHGTTDSTLKILHDLRRDFPETGAVLQAYLHRTEDDCRRLAHEGSRVRLCKGAYREPPEVAFQDAVAVDRAFVRCLDILFAGQGYPMIATHDPRMVELALSLAGRYRRRPGTYELQMLYGVRTREQQRLAEGGETVRVYVPYGGEWFGYLIRRMAERPQNLVLFLRSLISSR